MPRTLKTLLRVLGALIVLLFAAKIVADLRYFGNYDPAVPFNAVVEHTQRVDDVQEVFGTQRPRRYQRFVATFESRPGERVPTLITLPAEFSGKLPVIVFLHGMGQDKGFLDEITFPFNDAGFAMACFDQHSQGERRIEGGGLAQVIAFRKRPAKTVNDARRLIDFLQTRPEIDPERVYLIGASFGAITGSTVVAFDKRIKAAVLVVGGGDLSILLDAPYIRQELPPLLYALATPLVRFIMRPADPIHYAADTAPTPLLFQNGDQDVLVTPAAGKALYAAAGEPKEIRWYPCDHPGLREEDNPIILQILDEARDWLLERDQAYRDLDGNRVPAE